MIVIGDGWRPSAAPIAATAMHTRMAAVVAAGMAWAVRGAESALSLSVVLPIVALSTVANAWIFLARSL